jgi:rhodanese-related sulfurtransferase
MRERATVKSRQTCARLLAVALLMATKLVETAEPPAPNDVQRTGQASATSKPNADAAAARTQREPAPGSRRLVPPHSPVPQATPDADCRVETVADTGPVTYTVPIPQPGSKKRVAQCLMPPKQALALVSKGTLLVVDTRRPDDFERYRIPGSMNIGLPFVKTKAFLRDRAFALVDTGRASGTLEDSCRQLRAAGFKQAAVLRGGLIGWRGANGAIEGDLLAQRELTRMAPVELAQEGAYDDWIVLSLAAAPAAEVRKFIPQAVPLKAGIDAKLAAEVRAAVAKRSRKGVEPRVLLVDSDGTRTERIEHLLGGKLAYPVMLLDGGLAGYRRFWTEQASIWAALDRGPRKPGCGV